MSIKKMNKYAIELSDRELYLIARITGTLLGYAVADRCCDRELVLSIFNQANEKLAGLTIARASASIRRDHV